jgi:hypothetical protein
MLQTKPLDHCAFISVSIQRSSQEFLKALPNVGKHRFWKWQNSLSATESLEYLPEIL